MSKLEQNKKQKQEALLNTAFELFTTKGINQTTISDIVKKAGMAKGTFYLYFTDKYDIRNKLIAKRAQELLQKAKKEIIRSSLTTFEDKMIFFTNYIVYELDTNKSLLLLIQKNATWHTMCTIMQQTHLDDGMPFYEFYLQMLKEDKNDYRDPEILLFTILHLVLSTCYSCLLDHEPMDVKTYITYINELEKNLLTNFIHKYD